MLRLDNLTKDFGALRVLRGVSLTLSPGDRVGIVGRNGTGKSTLLRIIAGLEQADDGQVGLLPGTSLAYLPQDTRPNPGRSVHDEALGGFSEVLALEARQRELEEQMREYSDQPDHLMPLVEEHARVHELFERRGGYTLEAEVGRVLAGLGFRPDDYGRPVEQLSGGWQMRVALARLLVQRPDILLLDEPTNHLDLAATEWLESYLVQYPGVVILVSHDRYLLNAVVRRYLELEDGQGVEYHGSYSAYVAARDQRRQALRLEYERQQEYIARQQTFIDRNRAGQKHAQAKSREKLLERLERVDAPLAEETIRFRFPPCHQSGREVVVLRNVAKRYASRAVFEGLDLAIERGDRVALVGPNGAGKSTLLRLLAQREEPSEGRLHLGQQVALSYYAQDTAQELGAHGTVLDHVYHAAPGWSLEDVRGLLGQLLFSRDDAYKPLAALSGGERARVVLARMLMRPSNLLVLDEPTNHLDVATREAVEVALRAYSGTLVFATHDRFLVDQLATRVWEVADGTVRSYLGNYSAYRRKRDAERAAVQPTPQESAGRNGWAKSQSDTRRRAVADRALERELARIEQQVADAETVIAELERMLANPGGYLDAEQAGELGIEYGSRKAELEVLLRRWEELAQAREERVGAE